MGTLEVEAELGVPAGGGPGVLEAGPGGGIGQDVGDDAPDLGGPLFGQPFLVGLGTQGVDFRTEVRVVPLQAVQPVLEGAGRVVLGPARGREGQHGAREGDGEGRPGRHPGGSRGLPAHT